MVVFFFLDVEAEVLVSDVVVWVVYTLERVPSHVEVAVLLVEGGVLVEELMVLAAVQEHHPVLVAEEVAGVLERLEGDGAVVAGKARSMDAEVLGMAFENLGFDVVTHPMTTPVMVRVVLALQGVAASLLLLVLRLDNDDVRLLLRLEVRLLRLDDDDGGWLVLRLHEDYLTFVLVPEAGVFFEEVVHRLVSCNV